MWKRIEAELLQVKSYEVNYTGQVVVSPLCAKTRLELLKTKSWPELNGALFLLKLVEMEIFTLQLDEALV